MCAPCARSPTSARRWPRRWGEDRPRSAQHARRCDRRERQQGPRLRRRARATSTAATSCCSPSSRSAAIRPRICCCIAGLRAASRPRSRTVRDGVRGIAVYLGYPEYDGDAIYNSAALLRDGQPSSPITARWRCRTTPCSTRSATSSPGDGATVVDLDGPPLRPDHLRGRLGAGAVPRAGRPARRRSS